LVVSGEGGQVALRLDKDASLRLDVASRVAIEAGKRIRLESGAVYLDNGSGAPGRGLEIVTPFGSVQDIGTQLEVRLVGDRLRVRVREGMASLRRQNLLATVRAGEEAALGGDGAVQLTRVAADDPGWGWVLAVAPAFPLEGSSAGALLRWAARECGLELSWDPPQLAVAAESIILHGDVAGLPPNEVPAVVLPTCGLAYRVEGGALVVSRRER
jgi:hypothetical protein